MMEDAGSIPVGHNDVNNWVDVRVGQWSQIVNLMT